MSEDTVVVYERGEVTIIASDPYVLGGDVDGPAESILNGIPLWDSIAGKKLKAGLVGTDEGDTIRWNAETG